jgi:hypothetical protein
VIVTITKFPKGAWIVIVAMPIIVALFLSVHRHYERVGRILHAGRYRTDVEPSNAMLLLVSDLGSATLEAVGYLRAVRPEELVPLWTGAAADFAGAALEWQARAPRLGDLQLLEGADHHLIRAVRHAVRDHPRDPDGFVTLIVPEVVEGGLPTYLFRRRTSLLLKTALLFEPGAVVTDVAFVRGVEHDATGARPVEPERNVVLVPIPGVHDAVVRAVVYARSLRAAHTEALLMVGDPEDQTGVIQAWHDAGMDIPLVMVEAPFRDLGPPLLAEIRRHTARPGTVVTVVLPELVPRHWWENLLHNQTALFVKRLLLFEPNVVLTSVPFHLRHAEVAPPPAP